MKRKLEHQPSIFCDRSFMPIFLFITKSSGIRTKFKAKRTGADTGVCKWGDPHIIISSLRPSIHMNNSDKKLHSKCKKFRKCAVKLFYLS